MTYPQRISAVPIVNENGQIVGNVSVKDIRMIAKEKAVIKVLYQSLTSFLESTRKDFDVSWLPLHPLLAHILTTSIRLQRSQSLSNQMSPSRL